MHRPLRHNDHAVPPLISGASVQSKNIRRKDGLVALNSTGHKAEIDWEIPRKILHSSIGFVTLGLYFLRPPSLNVIILPLSGALFIISSADFIRLRNPSFERLYERFLGLFMRESEKSNINGVVWYLVGVIFVLAVYPRDVAVVSILLLSWADTSASTFGRLYGHLTVRLPPRLFGFIPLAPRKSLAGSLAAFVIGTATTATFWGLCAGGMGQGIEDPVWNWNKRLAGGGFGLGLLSLGAGLITSVTECLDLASLDDNLTLPIIGGGLVWLWALVVDVVL